MKVRNEKTIDLCSKEIEQAVAEWVSDDHPEAMSDTAKYEFSAHPTKDGLTVVTCKVIIIQEEST